MSYLSNCWYMAAWADEVENGGLLARKLLDQPIVLFRDEQGELGALYDRCPHRFAPLSKGQVANGGLTCGYHGLAFDRNGTCAHNPHGPILRNLSVRQYPVVEAHRAIWIWMGDPALAEPGSIRDLSFLVSAPETAFSKGYLHGQGHYLLYVDNILDLTHVDYLHATTLGSGAFTRTRAQVSETDGHIRVRRDCLNEIPSPLMRSIRGITEADRVDYWNTVEWSAPAVMTLSGANVPAGEARDGPHNNMNTMNVHIMTPETSRTTHYFFASTRDFAVDDAAFNARFAETRNNIFSTEDEPMIQAQQQRMGDADFWDLQPQLLRIDEPSVRVRRKLAQMIKAEAEREQTCHQVEQSAGAPER
ncbi:aromatic ring-hydroxylating dioxygenase subunit alpha [Sphingopyxis panaciterrulae]|uniref:Vanillate O-demethylase monooxygenase subunit n=1 Tax=Sphingopyxis panaciterrulae TaxID=462372 RepID=A0A7W9B9V9_9SPHN|nr:aromatic ring-hydroxylating dioxygenase subunit alpha [Sphingopyxis panaciterrulae]MBB5708697.1 vanillate O-demethylase monooxygenase subunit [Sphingopyxis panaciterrulae]